MEALLEEIRCCKICSKFLPHGPNPIVAGSLKSEILIIGQAPGRRVHESGVPWDDPSGRQLREWLGIDRLSFYNPDKIALVPMGFCYPGKGKSGDLPPRPECAEAWHEKLVGSFQQIKLTLLIGQYAQKNYLHPKENLTETVRSFQDYFPEYLPLPHPSPRNRFWMKKNPWFDESVLPLLKQRVKEILND